MTQCQSARIRGTKVDPHIHVNVHPGPCEQVADVAADFGTCELGHQNVLHFCVQHAAEVKEELRGNGNTWGCWYAREPWRCPYQVTLIRMTNQHEAPPPKRRGPYRRKDSQ